MALPQVEVCESNAEKVEDVMLSLTGMWQTMIATYLGMQEK